MQFLKTLAVLEGDFESESAAFFFNPSNTDFKSEPEQTALYAWCIRLAVVVYDNAGRGVSGFSSRKLMRALVLSFNDFADLPVTVTIWVLRGSLLILFESDNNGASSKSTAVLPPAALKLFKKTDRFPDAVRCQGTGVTAILTFLSFKSRG